MMATAWIAGGSGLVGGELLSRLLQDETYTRVVSVGRRTVALQSPRLQQAVVDLSRPASLDVLPAPEVVFSCLGTTIAKAGSREAFRAVDLGAVVALARAAHAKGARALLHVSALGADPRSFVFYNRVKGEAEEAVGGVGIASVYALRPSILDGERKERRPAERVGLLFARALAPVLGKYRPTPAASVAAAMVLLARRAQPGVHVVESDEILRIAAETR